MKKLLLFATLFVIAFNLKAQTFTYTGTGNWTNQANWSPSYPGDDGLENHNYNINIDGHCTYNIDNPLNSIQLNSQLTVSGIFNTYNHYLIYANEDIYLDGGTIVYEPPAPNPLGIEGLFISRFIPNAPLPKTILGSGTLETDFEELSISNSIVSPGTNSSAGTINIHFINSIASDHFKSKDTEYIFDIFSDTAYDVLRFNNGIGIFQANDNGTTFINVTLSINHATLQTINSNASYPIIVSGRENFYNNINYTPLIINGFQEQLNYVPSTLFDPELTVKDLVITYLDIEAPTITNCPDPNVTANCGIYYEIPDYSTIITATDNDPVTTITYTQSIPAGFGAVDGTEITITATDNTGNTDTCTFTYNVN